MTPDSGLLPPSSPGSDPWDCVARELRARKESQRRAWGDVDDATLGRYLAGEVSGDERASVEQALAELPELRKLTDLVRDVLRSPECRMQEAEHGTSGKRPAAIPSQGFGGVPPPTLKRWRYRASLVTAACLLIVVGAAMPRSAFLAAPPPPRDLPALADAVAMRAVANPPSQRTPPRSRPRPRTKPEALAASENALASRDPLPSQAPSPVPSPPVALSVVGRFANQDLHLTPRQAVALHRQGFLYHHQGDVARAEAPLAKAYFFCAKKYGPQHPATQSSGRQLARVYAMAYEAADHVSVGGVTPPSPRHVAKALDESAAQLRERLAGQPIRDLKAQVVPVLQQALRAAPDVEYRRTLVRALGQLGPAAQPAVPLLAERLGQSTDPGEVREVLLALEHLGEVARPAVPALVQLAGERDVAAITLMAAPDTPQTKADKRQQPKHKVGDRERRLAARVLRHLQSSEGRVGVHDEAGCFTLRTVRAMSEQLTQLGRTSGVEVLVETGRVTDHEKLARLGTRALLVTIDPAAPSVRVRPSRQLEREGFAADKVRDAVQEACGKCEFDRALAAGVQAIRRQVDEVNRGSRGETSPEQR